MLLVPLLLFAAGCSADSEQSSADVTTTTMSAFESARRAGVEQLFTDWAAALRADDADVLRGLIDPQADPSFVDAQLARAQALADVPLSSFDYELVDSTEIPVPPRIAAGLDVTDIWAPAAELRYALADSDEEPTALPVSLVLTRHGDRWQLFSDTALAEDGRYTHTGPWDYGPVVTERVDVATSDSSDSADGSSVSTVLGHPDQQAEVDAVAAALRTAVPAVTDFWGPDWAQRAVVFVSSSPEEFDGVVSGGRGTVDPDLAAVTVSDAVEPETRPSGQRIVIGPRASDLFTDRTRETVIRHELTHVAARSVTGDGAPLWLLEGFADYSAYRGSGLGFRDIAPTLGPLVVVNGPPTVLPSDEAFTAGESTAAVAYESAWSISAYVADRYSEADLLRMYRQLAGGPLEPEALDATLTALFGVNARTFVAQWSAWVSEQARAA